MKALVYGEDGSLLTPIPALLARAGFQVDAISTQAKLKKHNHIKNFTAVNSPAELIDVAREQSESSYDLIVCSDDHALKNVVQSNFSEEEKLRLLPVTDKNYFSHIGSKIGFSKILKQYGVNTPAFEVANHFEEVAQCAKKIGFPLFVKVDFSAGGAGVYECHSEDDFKSIKNIPYPALVQKKIDGKLITGDGLFINKKPIFFQFAEAIICRPNTFGPSAVRKYHQPTESDLWIFNEVCALANALGANGFVNLTWIESPEHQELFFIEADMRPTVWTEHAKYFREDPAMKIKRYFEHGETLTTDTFIEKDQSDVILAYAPRLSYREVLLNKYHCRKHYSNYCDRSYILTRGYREIKDRLHPLFYKIKNGYRIAKSK